MILWSTVCSAGHNLGWRRFPEPSARSTAPGSKKNSEHAGGVNAGAA